MTPPLGALRKPVAHRIGLSHEHNYGYKDLVRDNKKNQQDLLKPQRQAALASSIARGYARHLGLGVPVDPRATAAKQQTPTPAARPASQPAASSVPVSPPRTQTAPAPRPNGTPKHATPTHPPSAPLKPVVNTKIYPDTSVEAKAGLMGVDKNPVDAKSRATGQHLKPAPGRPNQFVTETGELVLQQWGHIREAKIQGPPHGYRGTDRKSVVYSSSQNWTFDKPAHLPNGKPVFVSSTADAERLKTWKSGGEAPKNDGKPNAAAPSSTAPLPVPPAPLPSSGPTPSITRTAEPAKKLTELDIHKNVAARVSNSPAISRTMISPGKAIDFYVKFEVNNGKAENVRAVPVGEGEVNKIGATSYKSSHLNDIANGVKKSFETTLAGLPEQEKKKFLGVYGTNSAGIVEGQLRVSVKKA